MVSNVVLCQWGSYYSWVTWMQGNWQNRVYSNITVWICASVHEFKYLLWTNEMILCIRYVFCNHIEAYFEITNQIYDISMFVNFSWKSTKNDKILEFHLNRGCFYRRNWKKIFGVYTFWVMYNDNPGEEQNPRYFVFLSHPIGHRYPPDNASMVWQVWIEI